MNVLQVKIDRGKGLTLELRDSFRDKGIGVRLILGARVFKVGRPPGR
jgi:hypothetical protein